MIMCAFLYLFISVAMVVLGYLIHNYIKYKRFWKLLDAFYGDKPWPIFGNSFQLGSNSEEFLNNTYKMFERAGHKTYKFTVGYNVFVNLCEPEAVEVLLNHTKETLQMEAFYYLRDWLGDGLLLSTGDKWKSRRKHLTPVFHFGILQKFVIRMDDIGDVLVKKLSTQTGKLFDVYPFINICALDIICDTIMGVHIDAQNNKNTEYVEAIKSVCNLLNKRFRSPLKRNSWLYEISEDYDIFNKNKEILHNMTDSVIEERKLILKDEIEKVKKGHSLVEGDEFCGSRKKIAFLDILLLSRLRDGSFLTDEEVREETETFMFAGHDTSAATIAFAIYELSRNPNIQQKALEEIISIVGDNKDITYENLHHMRYLEMVIKETLRLYPSVPKFGRVLEDDLELPDGKIIPSGCTVMVDSIALGRNPRFYPNPERFDPERFSAETFDNRHPFLFIPFSAGEKNCLGQTFAMLEMKVVLSKILLRYELISGGEQVKVRLSSEVILKSENGMQLIIHERRPMC